RRGEGRGRGEGPERAPARARFRAALRPLRQVLRQAQDATQGPGVGEPGSDGGGGLSPRAQESRFEQETPPFHTLPSVPMRRILPCILAPLFVLTLAACDSGDSGNDGLVTVSGTLVNSFNR